MLPLGVYGPLLTGAIDTEGDSREAVRRGDRLFRWRGGDVSRLEGLTDGVFALSATVLVVPFEARGLESYAELRAILSAAPVLLVCFAFLVMVWQFHQRFHRRYGLEDGMTLWINGAFLFLLLLTVYPLKLLASLLVGGLFEGGFSPMGALDMAERRGLMTVYGVLIGLLFASLFAMTWRALRLRRELDLDPAEVTATRVELCLHGVMIAMPVASLLLTWSIDPALGGLAYFAIGPLMGLIGWTGGRRVARLAQLRSSSAAA